RPLTSHEVVVNTIGATTTRTGLTVHPDDLHAITTGALDRRLYTIVIPLLRSRADAGDPEAAYQLAELLAVAGDRDELRARANAGDGYAAYRLARMLAAAGDDRLHRFGFDVHGEIADGPAW
ncbi:hypothetical protein, partial [Parafrankia sp. Ea1.12]|uniref:hypothetical protein n=1 Tax=Parafrankia sp. Ea1.12 TaxID=573499 RepID=UPI0011BE3636